MFIKPYKMRLAVAVICMALSGASNVVVPWLIKDVIDKVLANKDIYTLNLIVIGILILFLLRGFFYFGQKYLMSFVGQKIVNDIRETLYRHLQTLSLSYFDKHKTGNIMSNLTNDVTALQTAIAGNLISFVQEAVILVGSLGVHALPLLEADPLDPGHRPPRRLYDQLLRLPSAPGRS